MPQNNRVISGTRYINGEEKKGTYIATELEDGYCYFNDDRKFRYLEDEKQLEVFYDDKQIWVITDNIVIDEPTTPYNVMQDIANMFGAGTVAPNANIETAVRWAIDKITNNYITYDYTTNSAHNLNSLTYNCSTFVITAMDAGGFITDSSNTNTTTMVDAYTALGFEWIPGNYFPANSLIRGDIQINTNGGAAGHTNLYIGEGLDADCGATPGIITTHTPDNWGRGWHGILRYPTPVHPELP